MNKVMLIGRITHDLDLRYTPSGTAVLQFNIAINRPKDENGEQKADFPTIVVCGKQAENLNRYQKKGSQIGIVGRIQTRNYDDKDGKKVFVTEVVAEEVYFADSKKNEPTVTTSEGFMQVEGDSDLPF